ncbi:MAG: helix-turn-helix domain-containing protein [Bradyrhizobium sp.]
MSIPPGMETAPAPGGDAARLNRRHWQRAALETLTEGGIAAVTVPRLAKRLGVTKGSFYWHFDSVDDLLRAALSDWERIFTDERLAEFAAVTDPRKRLEPWLSEIGQDHPAQRLHLAIEGAADHPVIGEFFARVSAKRIAFIARALREAGIAAAEAGTRAIAIHAAYLGFLRLNANAPQAIGAGRARARHARTIFSLLGGLDASASIKPARRQRR